MRLSANTEWTWSPVVQWHSFQGGFQLPAPLFQHLGVISIGFFSSPGCHALFLSKLLLLYRNSRYWLRVNCLDPNMPAIMLLFDNTLFLAVYLLFLITVIKVWPEATFAVLLLVDLSVLLP